MDTRNGRIYQDMAAALERGVCKDDLMELPSGAEVKVGQRIGPNDRCPCGSGKKFKRCCKK